MRLKVLGMCLYMHTFRQYTQSTMFTAYAMPLLLMASCACAPWAQAWLVVVT